MGQKPHYGHKNQQLDLDKGGKDEVVLKVNTTL